MAPARESLVRIEGDHLELAGRSEVDLRVAENLGRRLLAGEVFPAGWESVVEVLSHDLLPAWDEPWVDSEREWFRETRVHVLEALAAHFLDRGDQLLAIRASLKAIECSPYRDTSHRLLVHAYREEGNWLSVLRRVLRYRQHLGEELNLPPDRVLTDLFDELAGGSGSLAPEPPEKCWSIVASKGKDLRYLLGRREMARPQIPIALPCLTSPEVSRRAEW